MSKITCIEVLFHRAGEVTTSNPPMTTKMSLLVSSIFALKKIHGNHYEVFVNGNFNPLSYRVAKITTQLNETEIESLNGKYFQD